MDSSPLPSVGQSLAVSQSPPTVVPPPLSVAVSHQNSRGGSSQALITDQGLVSHETSSIAMKWPRPFNFRAPVTPPMTQVEYWSGFPMVCAGSGGICSSSSNSTRQSPSSFQKPYLSPAQCHRAVISNLSLGVSDGISMGTQGMCYSLQSRDLIADNIETVMSAHWYDGNISIPSCDKNREKVDENVDDSHVIDGWDSNSVDPCTWDMVACFAEGFVISLYAVTQHWELESPKDNVSRSYNNGRGGFRYRRITSDITVSIALTWDFSKFPMYLEDPWCSYSHPDHFQGNTYEIVSAFQTHPCCQFFDFRVNCKKISWISAMFFWQNLMVEHIRYGPTLSDNILVCKG
ncbi:hypothetical protein F3Y22_tig00110515pilonHSYRG00037 [Hibiscus syriacus]|uniref:Uncharacterized protein n=1 Tax=Hibiscus syriacus TaxID=106335 RepID=A0A6A3AFU2_HIBSY|nr:hypothetical protein F3Y22_tig00110515pilonHSYRG00037 [Hibiscus syriacus]